MAVPQAGVAEPDVRLGRPIPMNARPIVRIALQVGLVAFLVGCASTDPPQRSGGSSRWSGCAGAAYGETVAEIRGRSGAISPVSLLPAGEGPCAGALIARTGERVVGADVAELGLVASSATVVRLRPDADGDRRELLLVRGGVHPRGGYQPHVFVLDERLRELRVDGDPLVPFIATDGGAAPLMARCTDDGGVEVLTATLAAPPTKPPVWDVARTTYRWDGGELRRADTDRIHDSVPESQVSQRWPGMSADPELFTNCRG